MFFNRLYFTLYRWLGIKNGKSKSRDQVYQSECFLGIIASTLKTPQLEILISRSGSKLSNLFNFQLFINNEFVDAVSKKTFAVSNPANEKTIIHLAEGDKADVDLAVEAARKAFCRGSVWRNTDPTARGALLNKLAALVERDCDIIANLTVLENGKTFASAQGENMRFSQILRFYAGFVDKYYGKTIPVDGTVFTYTRKEPIGVVGLILPWNFPVIMLAYKWAPAIAAGCTIVTKPAEQTPMSTLYIAALSKEAGFPDGVINVVNGFGPTVGHSIVSHLDVRKVAFTGSTEVGRLIMKTAADSNLKKVSLELGGKSPLVIFDDVDRKLNIFGRCV